MQEFIENTIYKHPNRRILLQDLSNLYVLVASYDAQCYLRSGEKTWKDIMDEHNYNLLTKNRKHIIAYMLVSDDDDNIHYIELFDTIVKGHNLGEHIFNKYENKYQYQKTLIPKDIIYSSAKYWAKILNFVDSDGKIYKNYIDEFLTANNINKNTIKWQELYDLCEDKDGYDNITE
jgi:hypothetical protein